MNRLDLETSGVIIVAKNLKKLSKVQTKYKCSY